MRLPLKVALAAVAASTVVLAAPTIAFAHAVVFPKVSTTGTFERYVLRVPNEKPSPRRASRFASRPRVA